MSNPGPQRGFSDPINDAARTTQASRFKFAKPSVGELGYSHMRAAAMRQTSSKPDT